MSWKQLACIAMIAGPTLAMAQETYRPDDKVPRALAAQITTNGFDALEQTAIDLVPTLLGDTLELDDIEVGGGTFGLSIANIKPNISVRSLDIVPVVPAFAGAELEVFATLDVGLNSSVEPYDLRVSALFDACDGEGWIDNVTVRVGTQAKGGIPLEVIVIDGQFQIDATLPSDRIAIANTNASGECAGLLEFVFNSFSDVIIDAVVVPEIRTLLNGDGGEPGLIDDLNDSLGAATIALTGDDAIEVLDAQLNIELTPRSATTNVYGLELVYDSKITAAQDPCVEDIDPLGSLKTNTLIPDIAGETAPVAALVSDDLVNQAIYAVGTSGLLCLDALSLLGDSVDIPIPLNDELIYLIAGDDMREVVDPGSDIQLLTQPTLGTLTSTVKYDGAEPIQVDLQDLEINIYADVASRRTRVVGVAADALVGVDVPFDGTTGVASVELALDDAFGFENVGDEFYPGQGVTVAEGLEGLVSQLLGLLLPSLLGDLSFELPSFSGIGLTDLSFSAAGMQDDWLRGVIDVGVVSYGGGDGGDAGCGGCGGDAGGDCGGGCANGALNLGTYLLLLFPLVALRRRRS